MELSSSNIKKILNLKFILPKESFSCISANGTLHFPAQARKIKNNPPGENSL